MDIGAIIIIIIIGIILVLTFYAIGVYNNLLDAKNKVEDKFEKIDIEIKKTNNLTAKLLEIMEKNTKHEEKLIKELKKELEKSSESKTINLKIVNYNNLIKKINKALSLEETYKELKTNIKLTSIKKELESAKDNINYAKDIYNKMVKEYNSKKEETMAKIIAKLFKFENVDTI